jgi:hypothetical protein
MPTTVTVDLSAIQGALTLGENYRIALDESFVVEQGNNFTPNPSTANLISFANSRFYFAIANFTARATATTIGNARRGAVAPLTSIATLAIDGAKITYLQNVATSYSYSSNSVNDIFGVGTTPQLGDTIDGTFTVTLSTANGDFASTTDPLNGNSPLSYTGNKAQVNAWLDTIRFYPDKNYTSNTTFTITLVKSGTGGYTVTKTPALNFAGASGFTPRTYTITTNGTWTPQFEEIKYGTMDYAIIGGGGSGAGCYGGTNTNYAPCGGSGGGAGQVTVVNAETVPNATITVTIGSGGSNVTGTNSGVAGGSTIVTGWGGVGGSLIAGGGGGGIYGGYTVSPPTSGGGGLSGASFQGAPMRFQTFTFKTTGGGGGGAGGHASGYNQSQSISSGDGLGGPGGAGITFRSVTYGVGGPGVGPAGSTVSASTTYGSGGRGQNNSYSNNTAGQNGAVIIYIYG